jgi:alpha-glucosidase
VVLEGDIGGGLVLQRQIYFPKNATNIIQINSSLIARSVGPGSGGFSRFDLKLFLYTTIIALYRIYDNC